MADIKKIVSIKDKDLAQVKGGLNNWVSRGNMVVQCNANCYGDKADHCELKNQGLCKYNH